MKLRFKRKRKISLYEAMQNVPAREQVRILEEEFGWPEFQGLGYRLDHIAEELWPDRPEFWQK